MTLTAGNVIRFPGKAESVGAAGGISRAEQREVFLDYLLPVKKHLYNFIRKTMNFSLESDDLFQDTLLKGFLYFHSFDRGRSFKTWIFTIAHNLMKDAFRERDLSQGRISLEEAEEMGCADSQTGISADIREIYMAAARLKPRQREIFFLYYYNEFGVSEIAEITGLSRTNIKFILHQGRNAVKAAMEVKA